MRRKSLFEDDGPQDISEALMTMSSSQAKPYPPGVLPEPGPGTFGDPGMIGGGGILDGGIMEATDVVVGGIAV